MNDRIETGQENMKDIPNQNHCTHYRNNLKVLV